MGQAGELRVEMGDQRGAACLRAARNCVRCGAAERVRRAVARGQGSGGGREKTVTVTTVEVESTAYVLRLLVCG